MAHMFNRKIIDYLSEWKNKKERKPLIIRGARQVGKTSAVQIFAKKYFKDTVYLNLDNVEHSRLFKEELSLDDFDKIINIKFGKKIIPYETLIFIDEIQNSSSLIKLLRFFYEERPGLHVIATGSLLQAKLEKEGFSVPVGRVEFIYMYPLDFFEYLEARNKRELLSFLQGFSFTDKIPEAIHQEALGYFYEYTMIGGMPEVVRVYLENADITNLKSIYSSLFTGYCEDVYKYSSLANVKYISYIIEHAPLFAGMAITYEKFGGSNFKSREISNAFSILDKVMLSYQVSATESKELPIVGQRKRPKKLLFLDIGLVNDRMGIQEDFLNLKDLNSFYRGRIAEQVVGQNILSQFTISYPSIFYWSKKKTEGSAEVDFCMHHKGKILGIEVKSGDARRLRSIFSFTQEVKNNIALRIHGGNLKKEKIHIAGKSAELISIPFYLVPRILHIY